MTRLRDTLCFPLLMVLHLIFTVSSLVLRVYELLTTAPPESEYDEISTSRTRSNSSIRPPGHVGMVILSPPGFPSRSHQTEWGISDLKSLKSRKCGLKERTKIVECVLNLVELAAEEGIDEISICERSGKLPPPVRAPCCSFFPVTPLCYASGYQLTRRNRFIAIFKACHFG